MEGFPMSKSDNRHDAMSRPDLMRVAVNAGCDYRCVVKYLRISLDGDDEVRLEATTRNRIEQALRSCGYDRYVNIPPPRPLAKAPAPTNGAPPKKLATKN
jgi:hypothetical protein